VVLVGRRLFITGPTSELLTAKKEIMERVECDDGGEVQEFVGCKIDIDDRRRKMQITQPVLLQSFMDEFLLTGEDKPKTPGVPLRTLQLGQEPQVQGQRKTYFRSGEMHLRRWSRPEMANALLDLSRCNTNGSEEHINAMHRAMRYAVTTPNRGLTLAPTGIWDGDPTFEFVISGTADASYKPYHDIAASVGDMQYFYKEHLLLKNQKYNNQPHFR
jgi:hypothetical protein